MGAPAPTPWLETARLALRRFTLDDLDTLARLNADPLVTRHLGGVKDRAATEALLRTRILEYYDRHPGLGIWATIERASGAVAGFHVLNHIQGETDLQVGYALFTEHWGKGYATEMAIALLGHGYATLGLPQVNAITTRDNLASQRVLLKAGLERRGERSFAHPAYAANGPMAWFESQREAWLAVHS
ncbi:MAG: GNAT family N-acetyltransferase [Vicinamibacterales bacterium]